MTLPRNVIDDTASEVSTRSDATGTSMSEITGDERTKSLTCNSCGKAFSRRYNLRRHLQKVHGHALTNPPRKVTDDTMSEVSTDGTYGDSTENKDRESSEDEESEIETEREDLWPSL